MQEVPLGPNARAMLVDCPPLYDRAGIYAESTVGLPDNPDPLCVSRDRRARVGGVAARRRLP